MDFWPFLGGWRWRWLEKVLNEVWNDGRMDLGVTAMVGRKGCDGLLWDEAAWRWTDWGWGLERGG